MNRQDHDIELKEALQNDIKIPEIVDDRMEEMYDKIRSGEVRMKQPVSYTHLAGLLRKVFYIPLGLLQ